MNKTTMLSLLAMVVFGLLCSRHVVACPHCNIHNYLAGSVQSSSNMFSGKVLRSIDERTVEVEVLKVLHGQYKVGSNVKARMYGSKEHIGKRFLFSDPTSWPPRFEVLPLEFEDEVSFLMQEHPAVNSVKEAITRVQGVSVMTQGIGMEYLTNHYDQAVGPLVVELDTLMPDVFSTNDVFFGEHRLGKLLEALLSNESDRAKEFALMHIGKMAKLGEKTIDWDSIPYAASSRAVFLQDMLRHSQKHKNLSADLRDKLMAQLSSLSGRTLADAVYGLVLSTSVTADDIQKALKTNGESADMLALGLYFSGNYNSRWWAYDKAYTFWDKALAIVKKKELRTAISEQIKRSENLHKREKSNANKAIDNDK